MNKTRSIRLLQIIFVVIFILACSIPLIGMMYVKKDVSENEKRKLNEFHPRSYNSLTETKDAFIAFFNDHFFLRDWLVTENALIKYELANYLPTKDAQTVLFGKNGFLFLYHEPYKQQLNNKVDEKKVVDYWVSQIDQIAQYTKDQDIGFYFIIAPDKSTIYSEYLPDSPKLDTNLKNLASVRIYNKLSSAKDNTILLNDVLLNAKKNRTDLLYYKQDYHWNYDGAFVAYNYFMDEIAAKSHIKKTNLDLIKENKKSERYDLLQLIGLADLADENVNVYFLKDPSILTETREEFGSQYTSNSSNNIKALILHDSYFEDLKPFISANFKYTYYISNVGNTNDYPTVKKYIDAIKPDILIYQKLNSKIIQDAEGLEDQ